jgi:hypothetical protein
MGVGSIVIILKDCGPLTIGEILVHLKTMNLKVSRSSIEGYLKLTGDTVIKAKAERGFIYYIAGFDRELIAKKIADLG